MQDELENQQSVTNDTGTQEPQEDTLASETDAQVTEDQDRADSPDGADEGEETGTTTDRGTKVAKEPQSQYYQQLKNENADMRRLLADPRTLKEYLRDVEGTPAPEQGKPDDLAQLVQQATAENGQVDALKLAQLMDDRAIKRIEEGQKFLSANLTKSMQMARAYDEDKATVRGEHPELDPRNKDRYDPELEQFVADRYIAQGGLEGKTSLKDVVDQTFTFLTRKEKTARAQANTDIVRKKAGAITQPTVQGNTPDTEAGKSPAQILTDRVRKQMTG